MSDTKRKMKRANHCANRPVSFQMPADDYDEMMEVSKAHGISKSLLIRKSVKFATMHKWNKKGNE